MNMNEMMSQMTEKMMEVMMQSVMQNMMNSMAAAVAPKEQEEVKPVKKAVKTMTREGFFSLEEDFKHSSDLSELDVEPVTAKSLCYNSYVPSDVWIANHIDITQRYNAKWSSKLKAYTFPTHAEAVNFAQSYRIKTKLDDNDRNNVKAYKAERAKAKAEYYAKKAAEIK